MSTVKVNAAQIGQSITTTNNFTLYQPATPDGTVRWGVGNAGSVTDIVTLNSSGNVGIGTSSPNAKFAVQTSGADGINLMVDTAAPTQSCRLFLSNSTAGQSVTLLNISGALTFRYAATPGSGSGSEAMRIDSSGNVGIGTSSSTGRFTVDYTAPATFTNAAGDFVSMWRASGTNAFGVAANTTGTVVRLVTNNGYQLAFNNASTEVMRIDSSGGVLINRTTNGNSVKLGVNGAVSFYDNNDAQAVFFRTPKGVGVSGSGGFGLSYNTVNYTPGAGASNIYWDGANGYFTLSTSARRYKRNITAVTDEQLDKGLLLKPSYYQRLEHDYWEYGFIAEEVKDIGLDEFVTYAEGEISGLNYEKMVVIAFGLIQRQNKAIQEFSAQQTALKAELDATKAEVAALKGA